MTGKTVVITGATSGIGEVAAIRLAEQGARIVAVARDRDRAEATLVQLRQANPAADHLAHIADLSRLSEMKRAAREIAETEPNIDVLIDNAGAIFDKRQVTEDGLEMTFALNHMAYFVLTNMLLGHLKAGARMVVTASGAHRGAVLAFDDLQSGKHYSGFAVYSKSKLCNILFTRELARRLKGTGVTANALHPGFVATRFGDEQSHRDAARDRSRQEGRRYFAGGGRQDHGLSCVLAGRCRCDRRIFLPVQTRHADQGSAQRCRCAPAMGSLGQDRGRRLKRSREKRARA